MFTCVKQLLKLSITVYKTSCHDLAQFSKRPDQSPRTQKRTFHPHEYRRTNADLEELRSQLNALKHNLQFITELLNVPYPPDPEE